ncbi:MAG: hypothetical protein MUC79_07435 [Thiobacillaceae bacterium]|nr:hypothetical protein [Thiobacillaceae bacterium]
MNRLARCTFMTLLALLLPGGAAKAFEVADFQSGMGRSEVMQKLVTQWNFDKIVEPDPDTILAYDTSSEVNRRYLFTFCKGKLTGFEQDIKPSMKALVIVVSNHNQKYGQPAKVYGNTHMVSNGEKQVLGLFWKNNLEHIGVKYLILPNAEQLSLSFDVNNLCYPTPRF